MTLRREAAIIHRMQNRNTSFQNSSCTLCVPMFLAGWGRRLIDTHSCYQKTKKPGNLVGCFRFFLYFVLWIRHANSGFSPDPCEKECVTSNVDNTLARDSRPLRETRHTSSAAGDPCVFFSGGGTWKRFHRFFQQRCHTYRSEFIGFYSV